MQVYPVLFSVLCCLAQFLGIFGVSEEEKRPEVLLSTSSFKTSKRSDDKAFQNGFFSRFHFSPNGGGDNEVGSGIGLPVIKGLPPSQDQPLSALLGVSLAEANRVNSQNEKKVDHKNGEQDVGKITIRDHDSPPPVQYHNVLNKPENISSKTDAGNTNDVTFNETLLSGFKDDLNDHLSSASNSLLNGQIAVVRDDFTSILSPTFQTQLNLDQVPDHSLHDNLKASFTGHFVPSITSHTTDSYSAILPNEESLKNLFTISDDRFTIPPTLQTTSLPTNFQNVFESHPLQATTPHTDLRHTFLGIDAQTQEVRKVPQTLTVDNDLVDQLRPPPGVPLPGNFFEQDSRNAEVPQNFPHENNFNKGVVNNVHGNVQISGLPSSDFSNNNLHKNNFFTNNIPLQDAINDNNFRTDGVFSQHNHVPGNFFGYDNHNAPEHFELRPPSLNNQGDQNSRSPVLNIPNLNELVQDNNNPLNRISNTGTVHDNNVNNFPTHSSYSVSPAPQQSSFNGYLPPNNFREASQRHFNNNNNPTLNSAHNIPQNFGFENNVYNKHFGGKPTNGFHTGTNTNLVNPNNFDARAPQFPNRPPLQELNFYKHNPFPYFNPFDLQLNLFNFQPNGVDNKRSPFVSPFSNVGFAQNDKYLSPHGNTAHQTPFSTVNTHFNPSNHDIRHINSQLPHRSIHQINNFESRLNNPYTQLAPSNHLTFPGNQKNQRLESVLDHQHNQLNKRIHEDSNFRIPFIQKHGVFNKHSINNFPNSQTSEFVQNFNPGNFHSPSQERQTQNNYINKFNPNRNFAEFDALSSQDSFLRSPLPSNVNHGLDQQHNRIRSNTDTENEKPLGVLFSKSKELSGQPVLLWNILVRGKRN